MNIFLFAPYWFTISCVRFIPLEKVIDLIISFVSTSLTLLNCKFKFLILLFIMIIHLLFKLFIPFLFLQYHMSSFRNVLVDFPCAYGKYHPFNICHVQLWKHVLISDVTVFAARYYKTLEGFGKVIYNAKVRQINVKPLWLIIILFIWIQCQQFFFSIYDHFLWSFIFPVESVFYHF